MHWGRLEEGYFETTLETLNFNEVVVLSLVYNRDICKCMIVLRRKLGSAQEQSRINFVGVVPSFSLSFLHNGKKKLNIFVYIHDGHLSLYIVR